MASDIRRWFPGCPGTRVFVDGHTVGTLALVAAVAGKRYRLLRYYLQESTAAAEVNFESATTDISGPMTVPANGLLEGEPVGGLKCVKGEALNLVTTAGTFNGWVEYDEIQAQFPSTRVNA